MTTRDMSVEERGRVYIRTEFCQCMIWPDERGCADVIDFRHRLDRTAAPTTFINSQDELIMSFTHIFGVSNDLWSFVRGNTDELVEFFEALMPIIKEMRERPILEVLKEHEWKSVTT